MYIEEISNKSLCTGCGTCVGICPNSAIEIAKKDSKGIYTLHVNKKKCNNCGLCLDVCPGHSIDFNELNESLFGKMPEDILLGNYLNCYIGHSSDYEIRYNSSSGGLVTTLLIFALENGIIDGAIVTKMSADNPLEPEPFVAKTKGEIISASGSKYCPVPVNIALWEILRQNGKFAVVGLPCHIHGIRKAEKSIKKLRNRIVLHLGLFCGKGCSFLASKFLFQRLNIERKEIKKVSYRGEGWPGKMSIELKNGAEIYIPYLEYYNAEFTSFVPTRCTLCSDGVSELADISLGDAWLPELKDNVIGESIVISRNRLGDSCLGEALSKKKIELKKVSNNKVMQSQKAMLLFKKKNLKPRMFLFTMFGKSVPIYNQKLLKPELGDYSGALMFYLKRYILSTLSSKRHLRSIRTFLRFWKRKLACLTLKNIRK